MVDFWDQFGFDEEAPSSENIEVNLLLDVSNHLHRVWHVAKNEFGSGGKDLFDYTVHLALNELNKLYRQHSPTRIVACVDGRNYWRKDILPIYKQPRQLARKTDPLYPEFNALKDAYVDMLQNHTAITVLHADRIEADDWIGYWVKRFPDVMNIICATDKDFYQLHTKNVKQWHPNASQWRWIEVEDPKYELFLKCLRGETAKTSDNIPSAYPYLKTIRIVAAMTDPVEYANIMEHEIPDITNDGELTKVKTLYERNRTLMDLTQQPPYIIEKMKEGVDVMDTANNTFELNSFLGYLGKHELQYIIDNVERYSKPLTLAN